MRTRILVIVLVALAAVASAGVTWKVGHDYDARREADQTRSLGLGVRPSLLWKLDVRRLTDQPDDVLLGLHESVLANGYGSVVDSPTHLLAAVGHPEQRDPSTTPVVDDVTLIGIDRADGSPDWKRRVGRVDRCSNDSTSRFIVCWSDNRVVVVDTATGSLRSETSIDFSIAYVEIVNDTVYISGGRTMGDRRTVAFTGGPVDAPTSRFRRDVALTGTAPYLAEVLPAGNVFTISDDNVGGVLQYRTSAFDLDTGAKRFTFDGDIRIVGNGLFRADSYVRATKFLLARDGAILETLPGGSSMVFPATLLTRGPFAPVIVGTGAYDPNSGAPLWTDPILEWNNGQSTVQAIIGDLVIVASPVDRSIVGLDVRTGRRVWQTPWKDAYWMYGGITNGRHFVFSDFTGMHAIDTKTGRIVWSVRAPRGVEPRTAAVATAGEDILRSTNLSISVWRARKGESR